MHTVLLLSLLAQLDGGQPIDGLSVTTSTWYLSKGNVFPKTLQRKLNS